MTATAFEVHLDVFTGPFEVLLGLISKHQLDVTEVALAAVTDEFVGYLRAAEALDLEQATSFLVVAATLLDLKAARLLPGGQLDATEDLALLEARDLLFARLLQYRAYKELALVLGERLRAGEDWIERDVGLDPELAAVIPAVVLGVGARGLAEIAARVLAPRAAPEVDVSHVHAPRVNVAEHVRVLTERLSMLGSASFADLCADCRETIEVIARFLAVLELLREGRISVSQPAALAALGLCWRSADEPAAVTP